jgi:hypothetical protein
MKQQKDLRQQSRAIESNNRRIVHFMFNPGMPTKMTPFTRKFISYLNGKLSDLEVSDQQKFDEYLEKLIEERLEEGEQNPIQYEDNQFFELELNTLENLAFAVADNPFVKSDV